MKLQPLVERMQRLAPLKEDDVEEFEELVGKVAELGTSQAAEALFEQLDDACDLEGVMQTVALTLCGLPVTVLVPAFVVTLPVTLVRSPAAIRDVVRFLIASDKARASLVSAVVQLHPSQASGLRDVLLRLGRFERYAGASKEVLDALP